MATLKQKLEDFKKNGINKVKLAVTDMDGVLRGKAISIDKFESVANKGAGFCDCILGWDINDLLYENASFTGWHTAFPDALYRVDLESERTLPDEGLPFFIADLVDNDGESMHAICPRNLLKRVLQKADKMGFNTTLAFEYEFFLFNETPDSIRQKNFKNLTSFTPGMCGYSILRSSTHSELFNEFMDYCGQLDIPLEGLHCESGPGVWEAAIQHDSALRAADKASLFKTFSKVFFQKNGLMATFMARWNLDYPGQSGHIHQSLWDKKSNSAAFYDESDDYKMSDLMKSYVAGQLKYMKPLLAMTTPTINSYTRLVKGFWAPTASTWGVENRTTALRVIPGNENSQRVEFRVGSADANPYVAAAAMIGSGLLGIEENLKLEDPIRGNAYAVQDELPEDRQFPTNLRDSARNLDRCQEARTLFGSEFVDHFVSTRIWEVEQYEKSITDWQLERYFELI